MIGLAPSSYSLPPDARPRRYAQRDAELRTGSSAFTWSSRATATACSAELQRQGVRVNAKRIRRVQQEYKPSRWSGAPSGWRPRLDHPHPVYLNLLRDRAVTGLNQAWVADITYIRILTGFLYLAAILDATAQGGGLGNITAHRHRALSCRS